MTLQPNAQSDTTPILSRYVKWLKNVPFGASNALPLKTLIRVLSYSRHKDRIGLLLSAFASICAGATLPLMNIIFAHLVKSFTSLATTSGEDVSKSFMLTIDQYVLYMVYLFIGRVILAYVAILGFRISSLRISAAIRLSYLSALFQQPISVLDALPPGQTAAIITVTANILQLGISERLSSLIQAISVICTALVIGCIYSWTLTLATSSGLVLIVAWYAVLTPVTVKKHQRSQEVEREASGVASEALGAIRMVAACGAEDKMSKSYNELVDQVKELGHKMSPIIALQHSPVFFTIYATFALCFWFAVKLYMSFEFANVQTLVVVLMSVMTMLAHINAISVPLTALSHALNAAQIFFTIIDAPKPRTSGLREPDVSVSDDIVFEKVNFAYPTRHDVKVLEGLSLRFEKGKTTAIVGPSGSGKSTIIGLVLRWYELGGVNPVTQYLRNGSISTDGKNIHETDLYWWRSKIGLVQQEPFLFNDTIFKNVEYGLVGTEWENAPYETKRQLVEQACTEAYADEFITILPDGYNTLVGEVGIKFSGGQRQRLAIARAIVRRPAILIFDEATSALDVTSERIVQAALDKVSQNRTTIIIAHRLSTVMGADKIIVLSKGKVVQEGTHGQLLAEERGPYWRLVNAQSLVLDIEEEEREENEDIGIAEDEKPRASVLLEKNSHDTIDSDIADLEEGKAKLLKLIAQNFFGSFGMLLAEQKRNWVGYMVMLIAAIGAASSYAVQAYVFARMISAFSYWGDKLRSSTNFLCLMLVVVAVGVGLSYFALGWTSNTLSARTVATYRKEYFCNTITKPVSFFDDEDHSLGMLTARLATDPTQLQQLLGLNMAMVCISIFNVVGCVTISFYFGWKFALVMICASLPVILVCGWYRVRHEVRFEVRNNEVFKESAGFATEAIRATRTVASLTLERVICKRYEALLEEHIGKEARDARVSVAVFAASDSLVLLCMAFALWYGGKLMSTGEYTAFEFLVIYLAIIQGSTAAGQWLSFGPNIAQVSAAANRIQSMRPVAKSSAIDNVGLSVSSGLDPETNYRHAVPVPLLWKGADIELHDVHFQYPTRKTPVLQGLSLKIRHGQFAAIVGPSGSGKTTIISLLERFYEPQRGSILYDGEDIMTIPLSPYRTCISLVAQEPYLFRGTIKENVLLGADPASTTEEQLHAACSSAGLHTFIASLPLGYLTPVGNAGVALSGGQKQRISIARALIRDPAVLLLDEATSSLDSETEREVQAVFEKTRKGSGRTMIVVAHRLATVQNADVIFVMDKGRVVERGSHGELVGKRGVYWKMCQAQALGA